MRVWVFMPRAVLRGMATCQVAELIVGVRREDL